MLRIAGEWGNSAVVLDCLLLRSKTDPDEIRAARAWREGCHRAFVQVKKLHDSGVLIDPSAPEWKGLPA